ncbi:MAG: hypothetical protein R3B81_00550 [bacterium]
MSRIRPVWPRVLLALLLGVVAIGAARSAGAETVREAVLASKYQTGDYAVYLGWHRPNDWQFEEHGTSAFPFGIKVRFRLADEGWLAHLRLEGDVTYWRRANDPSIVITAFQQPEFDALTLGTTLQYVLPRMGWVEPYVAGGLSLTSQSNDFFVFRPDVYEVQPSNPDQFALASWKRFDAGPRVGIGFDLQLGTRAFPFLEYRHLFGKVGISAQDVKIGPLSLASLGLDVDDVQTLPDDPEVGGRPFSHEYDWGGPEVVVGLKILF